MREVTVRTAPGKFNQSVEIGSHRLVADEPVEKGGTDAGPAPHELLAAALGACSSMTLRMYAERKGWPLRAVEVRVSIGHEGEVTRFHSRIRLEGELDDAQRARCLEIARRCPVHRTLTGKIEIDAALES